MSVSRPSVVLARDNPLAIHHVTQLKYRFQNGDWQSNLNRLEKMNFRGSIIGGKGSGKTTLMDELASRIKSHCSRATHYTYLPHETINHGNMIDAALEHANDHVLLIDGIERLPFLRRKKILACTRRGAGLVLNLHSAFLLPWQPRTWVKCETSEQLLERLLSELLLSRNEHQSAARELFHFHNGNLRMVFRDLYDELATGRLPL